MKKQVILLIISLFLISLIFISLQNNFFGITGNVVAENSLVAYYKFDGNPQDSSGNKNHGTIGEFVLTEGISNQAYAFGEKEDLINVLHKESLGFSKAFTVSAWVYLNKHKNFNGIISKSNLAAPCPFDIYTTAQGNVRFIVGNCQSTTTQRKSQEIPIDVKSWQYITLVYGESTMKTYLNGVEKNSESILIKPVNKRNDIKIGNKNDLRNKMDGKIDEIKIWNYALSEEEILIEYNRFSQINLVDQIDETSPTISTPENIETISVDLIEPKTPQKLNFFQKIINWFKNLS